MSYAGRERTADDTADGSRRDRVPDVTATATATALNLFHLGARARAGPGVRPRAAHDFPAVRGAPLCRHRTAAGPRRGRVAAGQEMRARSVARDSHDASAADGGGRKRVEELRSS